jgi:two-component system phosphate regulon response regulator PhoB
LARKDLISGFQYRCRLIRNFSLQGKVFGVLQGGKPMPKKSILLVDDEEDILELLRFNLMREGYAVTCAADGEKALSLAWTGMPDLIVLDLMLPDIEGLEVTRRLKDDSNTAHIPILMLTAKGEEADVVTGLELGADDYVTKPFSPRILLARIRAVLRRGTQPAAEEKQKVLRVHNLVIHPGRREVLVDNHPVALAFTEFGILSFLAARPGWVYTRNQIVDAVRGENYVVTERSVDVQIAGLRKKLGPAGKSIETVRGVGYRFKE